MMWNKILPLLIVSSVALNIAFVGAWGFRALRLRSIAEQPYEGAVWCPLHRELGVTADQWRIVEPKLEAFHRQSQAICQEMGGLRGEIIDLIAVENPDLGAIEDNQQKVRAGQQRMQELLIELLLVEKQVLNADQEAKLFGMMRDQNPDSRPGRMLRFGNRGAGPRSSSPQGIASEKFSPNQE